MFTLLYRTRSTLKFSQFRELHKNADVFSVSSTFDLISEKKAFLDVLPEVVNSVITGPKLAQLPEVSSWVKQLLDFTMGAGKLLRGLKVAVGYRMFEDPIYFSEEKQHSACVLGWAMEMFQTYLILIDDMMDGATMRRGKPCWHQQPDVGFTAIKDSTLIYQSMMQLLEMYFEKERFYDDLIKLFNEGLFKSSMGQHLDFTSGYNKKQNNLSGFTLENYNNIAACKAAHCSVKLPILLALLLVKNGTEKASKELDYICMELGRLLQIQDDYFDIYGAKTTTGKSGIDIQEGKCTWISINALQRCNATQRLIFEECYGNKNPADVKRIKQLYDELNMPQVYQQYENSVYHDLLLRIRALPTERQTKFFLGILNLYYKRNY